MESHQYKVGIIGYGGIGGFHHERISEMNKGLKVVAAHDVDPFRLEEAGKRGLKAYAELNDFLADEEIDVVLVSTPNNFHKTLAIAAMNAKKHVICEKPVAMNCTELEEMMAAAEENNVLFTVHQNRRWDPDYKTACKIIKDGMVGKPFTVESRVHGQNGITHGWRAYKVSGGGMMFDWGVHMIDQLLNFFEEAVVNVECHMHVVKTFEVDDYFKLLLRFESGISAQVEVGTYNLYQLPRWYIGGDMGCAVIHNWEKGGGGVIKASQLAMNWEPEIVMTSAGPTRTMAPRPQETLEELPLPEVESDWLWFYDNVVDALDGKAPLIVKPEQAMRVLRVIEAAFESDREKKSVKVYI